MKVIEKIDIKITVDQLNQVIFHLKVFIESPTAPTTTVKTSLSVLTQVFIKLSKKALNKASTKKPFKLSLEYYEAYFLEQCLKFMNKYNYLREVQNTIDTLNQKLA